MDDLRHRWLPDGSLPGYGTTATITPESTQLAGALALSQARIAAASSHRTDAEAALEYAAELAARTGEGTAPMGWDSAPPMVGLWRMEAMLEIGDHELVSALAKSLNPNAHAYRERRSAYRPDYGRALASASCCSGHGVTRWAGNCTGWPTGLPGELRRARAIIAELDRTVAQRRH